MEMDLMDLNNKIKINFVPTGHIFSILFFLQGHYDLEKMCIAMGDGEHKNKDNPYKLVKELCRNKIEAISYDDKKFIYTFDIQIPKQHVKEVTEFGLFYEDPEDAKKEILIAYAQQEQPFFRNEISLELLLPHYPVYREEEIGSAEEGVAEEKVEEEGEEYDNDQGEMKSEALDSEKNLLYASSFSSDKNAESEEKNINPREANPKLFNTDLPIIWNLTSDQGLTIEHTWNVQLHKKLFSEQEYIPLATKFNEEANLIYLMYKERKIVNAIPETLLFLQIYSLKKNVLKDLILFYKLPAKTHDKGIFTELNAKGFRFYISYPNGVFCVNFQAENKEMAQKIVRKHHNQFHPARVGGNSTLLDLEGNVGLVGGTIGGLTHGRGLASTGLTRESSICLGPSDYVDNKGVDDPVADYFKDGDELTVVGDKDPESKEKKKKGGELTIEIELDETELEIETSAVNTLKLNGTSLRKNDFRYFSDLSPTKMQRKPLKCFNRYAAKEFPRINALNYIHCKIEKELFLFHKEIFKNRERRVYFVFNVQDNTIKSYKLPDDVRDTIKDNYMDSYDYIQVAATNKKLIYFFLTRNPMLEQTLGMQVICLNVAHKCPIVE